MRTLTKTGSGSDVFMEYTLTNAVISDYSVGGAANDTNRPTESITISFVEMEARYTASDQDGNSAAPDSVGFDTSMNTQK